MSACASSSSVGAEAVGACMSAAPASASSSVSRMCPSSVDAQPPPSPIDASMSRSMRRADRRSEACAFRHLTTLHLAEAVASAHAEAQSADAQIEGVTHGYYARLLYRFPHLRLQQNAQGLCPLHSLCMARAGVLTLPLLQTVLSQQAEAQLRLLDSNGGSALMHLARQSQRPIGTIAAIVEACPEAVLLQSPDHHRTALHYLTRCEEDPRRIDAEEVHQLLSIEEAISFVSLVPASVAQRDSDGFTPLHCYLDAMPLVTDAKNRDAEDLAPRLFPGSTSVLHMLLSAFPEAAALSNPVVVDRACVWITVCDRAFVETWLEAALRANPDAAEIAQSDTCLHLLTQLPTLSSQSSPLLRRMLQFAPQLIVRPNANGTLPLQTLMENPLASIDQLGVLWAAGPPHVAALADGHGSNLMHALACLARTPADADAASASGSGADACLSIVHAVLHAAPEVARGTDADGWWPLHAACSSGARPHCGVIAALMHCAPEALEIRSNDREIPLSMLLSNAECTAEALRLVWEATPSRLRLHPQLAAPHLASSLAAYLTRLQSQLETEPKQLVFAEAAVLRELMHKDVREYWSEMQRASASVESLSLHADSHSDESDVLPPWLAYVLIPCLLCDTLDVTLDHLLLDSAEPAASSSQQLGLESVRSLSATGLWLLEMPAHDTTALTAFLLRLQPSHTLPVCEAEVAWFARHAPFVFLQLDLVGSKDSALHLLCARPEVTPAILAMALAAVEHTQAFMPAAEPPLMRRNTKKLLPLDCLLIAQVPTAVASAANLESMVRMLLQSHAEAQLLGSDLSDDPNHPLDRPLHVYLRGSGPRSLSVMQLLAGCAPHNTIESSSSSSAFASGFLPVASGLSRRVLSLCNSAGRTPLMMLCQAATMPTIAEVEWLTPLAPGLLAQCSVSPADVCEHSLHLLLIRRGELPPLELLCRLVDLATPETLMLHRSCIARRYSPPSETCLQLLCAQSDVTADHVMALTHKLSASPALWMQRDGGRDLLQSLRALARQCNSNVEFERVALQHLPWLVQRNNSQSILTLRLNWHGYAAPDADEDDDPNAVPLAPDPLAPYARLLSVLRLALRIPGLQAHELEGETFLTRLACLATSSDAALTTAIRGAVVDAVADANAVSRVAVLTALRRTLLLYLIAPPPSPLCLRSRQFDRTWLLPLLTGVRYDHEERCRQTIHELREAGIAWISSRRVDIGDGGGHYQYARGGLDEFVEGFLASPRDRAQLLQLFRSGAMMTLFAPAAAAESQAVRNAVSWAETLTLMGAQSDTCAPSAPVAPSSATQFSSPAAAAWESVYATERGRLLFAHFVFPLLRRKERQPLQAFMQMLQPNGHVTGLRCPRTGHSLLHVLVREVRGKRERVFAVLAADARAALGSWQAVWQHAGADGITLQLLLKEQRHADLMQAMQELAEQPGAMQLPVSAMGLPAVALVQTAVTTGSPSCAVARPLSRGNFVTFDRIPSQPLERCLDDGGPSAAILPVRLGGKHPSHLCDSIYQADHLLSATECVRLIAETSAQDSLAGEYSKDQRDATRLLCSSPGLATALWGRIEPLLAMLQREQPTCRPMGFGTFGRWFPHRLNSCFRFSCYDPGSAGFAPHRDSPLVEDAGERSIWTMLVYLSGVDDRDAEVESHTIGGSIHATCSGCTTFFRPTRAVSVGGSLVIDEAPEVLLSVRPSAGRVVFFPHEMIHAGGAIADDAKAKYVLRTDIVCRRWTSTLPLLPCELNWRSDGRYLRAVELFQQAFKHELAGRLNEAGECYTRSLSLRAAHKATLNPAVGRAASHSMAERLPTVVVHLVLGFLDDQSRQAARTTCLGWWTTPTADSVAVGAADKATAAKMRVEMVAAGTQPRIVIRTRTPWQRTAALATQAQLRILPRLVSSGGIVCVFAYPRGLYRRHPAACRRVMALYAALSVSHYLPTMVETEEAGESTSRSASSQTTLQRHQSALLSTRCVLSYDRSGSARSPIALRWCEFGSLLEAVFAGVQVGVTDSSLAAFQAAGSASSLGPSYSSRGFHAYSFGECVLVSGGVASAVRCRYGVSFLGLLPSFHHASVCCSKQRQAEVDPTVRHDLVCYDKRHMLETKRQKQTRRRWQQRQDNAREMKITDQTRQGKANTAEQQDARSSQSALHPHDSAASSSHISHISADPSCVSSSPSVVVQVMRSMTPGEVCFRVTFLTVPCL